MRTIQDIIYTFIKNDNTIFDLLHIYMTETQSRCGAVFMKEKGTTEFIHIKQHETDESFRYTHILPYTDDLFSTRTDNINGLYPIHSCIHIIIKSSNGSELCVVSLFNRDSEYDKESFTNISPYIPLTRCMIEKYRSEHTCILGTFSNVRDKDMFIANVSHEMRTPTNGIVGYGQLLEHTKLTECQRDYITSQRECCMHLMHIVNDILDFSRLSTGKMKISKEWINIHNVKSTVVNTVSHIVKTRDQTIVFDIDSDTPYVYIDRSKVEQILINLITNASSYSNEHQQISVTIKTTHNHLYVRVKDYGIGISKKNQLKIFNVFAHIDNQSSRRDAGEGVGLGLSICNKIVNLLNGRIHLESEEGMGSVFEVILPCEIQQKKLTDDLKNKHVLIVSDSDVHIKQLSCILKKKGGIPIVYTNAFEVLHAVIYKKFSFHIGFMNINKTNIDLCIQLKKEYIHPFPVIGIGHESIYTPICLFGQTIYEITDQSVDDSIYSVLYGNTPCEYIDESDVNKKINILIAEDDRHNRKLLDCMLHKTLGYVNVKTTTNGIEAVQAIYDSIERNDMYKVIFIDLRMPVMNGYEVLKKIKAENWDHLRVIVVTASITDDEQTMLKHLGVNKLLTKPIQLKQIQQIMVEYM